MERAGTSAIQFDLIRYVKGWGAEGIVLGAAMKSIDTRVVTGNKLDNQIPHSSLTSWHLGNQNSPITIFK